MFGQPSNSRKPFRDFVYCSAGRNGSPMYVKASGKPVFDANGEFRGYRGTGTDVTALMRAQEEHERLRQLESDLAHMNRLSMMGELAASLAHEITQPIASARNNARAALNFLDKQPPDLGDVREALACVVGDADRAGAIIDRIRDHIKKVPPRRHRFDLNEAINEVIGLARSAIIRNGVSVQTRLTEGLAPVQGDRVQLQQVVLNLILNAVDAMSTVEAGPRELLISTEQTQTGGVLVSVRDSGPGIDPTRPEQVFEAFYTTKSERSRDGTVDLQVDHRCPRGPAVGRHECITRGRISVHLAQGRQGAHEFSSPGSPDSRAARRHRIRCCSSTGLRR